MIKETPRTGVIIIQDKNNKNDKKILRRVFSGLFVIMLIMFCSACGDNKSNDTSMTDSIVDAYMNEFCNYHISGMNQYCMADIDPYDDSESAVKACRALAERIVWEKINISVDGNSAIAQLRLTVPSDMEAICGSALNDAVAKLDGGSDDSWTDLLVSAIRKRAGKAKTEEISVEIHMTKVDNKWYIVKSLGVNHIVSDIRTSVAAVVSIIEG